LATRRHDAAVATRPLLALNATTNGDLIEFVQVEYAPSGDMWASFVKEMCSGGMTMACTWALSGAVGRVVHR